MENSGVRRPNDWKRWAEFEEDKQKIRKIYSRTLLKLRLKYEDEGEKENKKQCSQILLYKKKISNNSLLL